MPGDDHGSRVAGCGLPVAGCRLQVAGCRLQVAGCRLQVAGCGSRVATHLSVQPDRLGKVFSFERNISLALEHLCLGLLLQPPLVPIFCVFFQTLHKRCLLLRHFCSVCWHLYLVHMLRLGRGGGGGRFVDLCARVEAGSPFLQRERSVRRP